MTVLSNCTILAKVTTCRDLPTAEKRRVRKAFLLNTLPWNGEYRVLKSNNYSNLRDALTFTEVRDDFITVELKPL
jgi:hypothetical protein